MTEHRATTQLWKLILLGVILDTGTLLSTEAGGGGGTDFLNLLEKKSHGPDHLSKIAAPTLALLYING